MSKLKNKVAIVTGASKGIGAGIAEDLAREGASVVVNYSSDRAGAEKVVATVKGFGGNALALKCNVSDAKDVESLFLATKEEFGQIDILVNNAGVYSFAPLEEFTEPEFHRIFNTNMLGPFLTCRESLKYLTNGGSIINIGSAATRSMPALLSIYSASKGGLDILTKVLAKEFGPKRIRVNSVNPGATETEGSKDALSNKDFVDQAIASTPLGRLGKPADIAKVVSFLASDEAGWLTGEIIVASGG